MALLTALRISFTVPPVVKRSASQAVISAPRRTHRFHSSSLPSFTAGREAASGPQWAHEIKLGGFRMAARIDQALDRALEFWIAIASGGQRVKNIGPKRFTVLAPAARALV